MNKNNNYFPGEIEISSEDDEDEENYFELIENEFEKKNILKGGTVYSCGYGYYGQLGFKQNNCFIPRKIDNLYNINYIACGDHHSIAISSYGFVFSWGNNIYGQLGLGDNFHRSIPTLIEAMRGTKIEQVACGSYHSVLLSHFGEVYTFGCGSFGRLGHGDHKHLSLPRIVASLRGKQIIKVSCGSWFTICLSDQGAVYSWGYNRFGQIGHGSHSVELLPRHITSFYGKKIVKLECGKHHTLFISDQNECFALGAGMCGQLGNRKKQIQLQPVKIEDLSKLKLNNIACGNLHSLALTSSGDIYMWGYISGDYLGLPETDEEYISAPKRMNISQIKNKIINIFAGGWHSAAITENGELYTWGFSDSGRLGIGNKIVEQDFHPLEPRFVEELKGKIIVSVACGSSHTLILALDT